MKIGSSQVPQFPSKVVIHNRACGNGLIEQTGDERLTQPSQVACVTGKEAPLPMRQSFSRAVLVAAFGFRKQLEVQALTIHWSQARWRSGQQEFGVSSFVMSR